MEPTKNIQKLISTQFVIDSIPKEEKEGEDFEGMYEKMRFVSRGFYAKGNSKMLKLYKAHVKKMFKEYEVFLNDLERKVKANEAA